MASCLAGTARAFLGAASGTEDDARVAARQRAACDADDCESACTSGSFNFAARNVKEGRSPVSLAPDLQGAARRPTAPRGQGYVSPQVRAPSIAYAGCDLVNDAATQILKHLAQMLPRAQRRSAALLMVLQLAAAMVAAQEPLDRSSASSTNLIDLGPKSWSKFIFDAPSLKVGSGIARILQLGGGVHCCRACPCNSMVGRRAGGVDVRLRCKGPKRTWVPGFSST